MTKVRVDRRVDTAEIKLSAPPLNLLDAALLGDLEPAVLDVRAVVERREVRAVLLRAEGRVFCAGVDVHEFQGLNPFQGGQLMARYLAIAAVLESLQVPTLAVVRGLNLTIGFELTLACDLMCAAEDASFGLVDATVGLTPGGGGTQRLVVRAGVERAAELVLTGDVYPAEEMYR